MLWLGKSCHSSWGIRALRARMSLSRLAAPLPLPPAIRRPCCHCTEILIFFAVVTCHIALLLPLHERFSLRNCQVPKWSVVTIARKIWLCCYCHVPRGSLIAIARRIQFLKLPHATRPPFVAIAGKFWFLCHCQLPWYTLSLLLQNESEILIHAWSVTSLEPTFTF